MSFDDFGDFNNRPQREPFVPNRNWVRGFHPRFDWNFEGNVPAEYYLDGPSIQKFIAWLRHHVDELDKTLEDLIKDYNNEVDTQDKINDDLYGQISALMGKNLLSGSVVTSSNYKFENALVTPAEDASKVANPGYAAYWQDNAMQSDKSEPLNALLAVKFGQTWNLANRLFSNIGISGGQTTSESRDASTTPPNRPSATTNNGGKVNTTPISWVATAIPATVRRVWPFSASEPVNGGVLYISLVNGTRTLFKTLYNAPAQNTVVSTEKPIAFLLWAYSPDEFMYISDDWTLVHHSSTGGELNILTLPQHVQLSLDPLSPEKVMGNAHQIVAMVNGNAGDNHTADEEILTWNIRDAVIDGSGMVRQAFTPHRFLDTDAINGSYAQNFADITGREYIFFNLAPDVSERSRWQQQTNDNADRTDSYDHAQANPTNRNYGVNLPDQYNGGVNSNFGFVRLGNEWPDTGANNMVALQFLTPFTYSDITPEIIKRQLDALVSALRAEIQRAQAAESSLATIINDVANWQQAYTSSAVSSAVSSAKSYTDSVGGSIVSSASSYTSSVGSSVASSARSYTSSVGSSIVSSAISYVNSTETSYYNRVTNEYKSYVDSTANLLRQMIGGNVNLPYTIPITMADGTHLAEPTGLHQISWGYVNDEDHSQGYMFRLDWNDIQTDSITEAYPILGTVDLASLPKNVGGFWWYGGWNAWTGGAAGLGGEIAFLQFVPVSDGSTVHQLQLIATTGHNVGDHYTNLIIRQGAGNVQTIV